jgi:hypothetical protein
MDFLKPIFNSNPFSKVAPVVMQPYSNSVCHDTTECYMFSYVVLGMRENSMSGVHMLSGAVDTMHVPHYQFATPRQHA